ncbi:MAG: hypothetical protein WCB85_01575 [Candidatus Dormiibacterota bacterium]
MAESTPPSLEEEADRIFQESWRIEPLDTAKQQLWVLSVIAARLARLERALDEMRGQAKAAPQGSPSGAAPNSVRLVGRPARRGASADARTLPGSQLAGPAGEGD